MANREPTYVDLYQKKPISKKQQKKQRIERKQAFDDKRQGENDLDFALLEMFNRTKFTYPQDRKRWHKITDPVYNLRNSERELYRAWIEKLMDWGSDKNMYAIMTACENTESWLDFRSKTKDSFQTDEQKQEVKQVVTQLEAEDDFDG